MIYEDLYIRWPRCQRLVDSLIERPIAPQRWRAYLKRLDRALEDRATARETRKDYELQLSARTAVSLTCNGLRIPLKDMPIWIPEQDDYIQRLVRAGVQAKINNLVTEDLLGPGWRHEAGEIDDDPSAAYEAVWLAEIELNRVLAECNLSAAEIEVLIGRYYEESWQETAERMRKSQEAVRQIWSRLRRRLSGQ